MQYNLLYSILYVSRFLPYSTSKCCLLIYPPDTATTADTELDNCLSAWLKCCAAYTVDAAPAVNDCYRTADSMAGFSSVPKPSASKRRGVWKQMVRLVKMGAAVCKY